MKCITIHLQLDESSNEVEISIPGNDHYLYARAMLSGEGWVYFDTSLPSFELSD